MLLVPPAASGLDRFEPNSGIWRRDGDGPGARERRAGGQRRRERGICVSGTRHGPNWQPGDRAEGDPSLSFDGSALYFHAAHRLGNVGTEGRFDLWVTTRSKLR